jgi:hypothetical protein
VDVCLSLYGLYSGVAAYGGRRICLTLIYVYMCMVMVTSMEDRYKFDNLQEIHGGMCLVILFYLRLNKPSVALHAVFCIILALSSWQFPDPIATYL